MSLSRAGILNGLKGKVGLTAAKAAALRINLNIDGPGPVGLSSSARCLGQHPFLR